MTPSVSFSLRAARSVAAALALATTALSSQAAIEVFTSGTTFFKRVITNTSVQILSTSAPSATTFADVPGTLTTVFVPAGSAVLISVNFDAEARCNGGNKGTPTLAADPNWCELMVLIGGVEASPQASTTNLGDTYSFVSTDNGNATFASWRGHAMSRHRCIRNTSAAPLAVAVSMQWKIVNYSPVTAPVTEFWLDDSAMVVQMSSGCSANVVPSIADGIAPTVGTGQSRSPSDQR
jgi:hypothetical protein